jgi:urocanate hydratase
MPAERIEMRLRTRYLDEQAATLDEALAIIARGAESEAGLGRPARQRRRDLPSWCARRRPDIVTDQTSAHDPINGYLPIGWTLERMGASARARSRKAVERAAKPRWRARAGHARLPRAWACRRSTTATTSASGQGRWA